MIRKINCDVVVIGGGHAGVEAAFASAKRKFKTILLSQNKHKLASAPCNPSIGGPAKGIITREIDALGGMQGVLTDEATIQIKMLNTSKGPAVRALRAQIDKELYSQVTLRHVEKQENLDMIEDKAEDFIFNNKKIPIGIKTKKGLDIIAKTIIITTGTYLSAAIWRGKKSTIAGPDNEEGSYSFAKAIHKLGLTTQRLKTGTPPRIFSNSIDFSKVEPEQLDLVPYTFSYYRSKFKLEKQVKCWLTYTNLDIHKIVNAHLDESSMYSRKITGTGPRYCPSIEDKIVRFKDRTRHQLFLEPETKKGDTIYLNGFSTSMPPEVQEKMLREIPGFAKAKIQKYAYAIEYDALDPLQLDHSLSLKKHPHIFFAGQINGTSGYEEAACQGFMAGINATLFIKRKNPFVLLRNEAYIGVLIDDLVVKGTKEPYRMLTSRAEYRLLLRNDNADQRLSHYGHKLGLVSDKIISIVKKKYEFINSTIEKLKKTFVSSNSEIAKKYQINNGESYEQVLRRPNVDLSDFIDDSKYSDEISTIIRLGGYINKQLKQAKKMLKREKTIIPKQINYDDVPNLASEARQKLKLIRPENIGQMCRISGINPADVQMLIYYLANHSKENHG